MKSKKIVQASNAAIDRLSPLLERFRVRANLFHSGLMCGTTAFDAQPGRAFLHVLRRGEMRVLHPKGSGIERTLSLNEPTLLLYPRPMHHVFVNPPRDGSDFTCATVDFDGGDRNPLVNALPSMLAIPLREVDGLQGALDLLFAETDRVRCGSRVLADRLFEVVLIQLLRWLIECPDRVGIASGLFAGLSDMRLARALVAVHKQPGEAWSIDRMAEEAGMSRASFAATFKSATGMTPADYLSDWRLTLASSLLKNGKPVKMIAVELGYASSASLSKAYKQRFGVSPKRSITAQQHRKSVM